MSPPMVMVVEIWDGDGSSSGPVVGLVLDEQCGHCVGGPVEVVWWVVGGGGPLVTGGTCLGRRERERHVRRGRGWGV